MKTLQHSKLIRYLFVLSILLSVAAGCTPWGYRGPLYKWTENDIVFFDFEKKTIRFADTSKKIFFVSISWNKNQYFEQKEITQNSSSFTIPDSLLNKITNKKVDIRVLPRRMTFYSISVKANRWKNNGYVFGQPINDISNYKEMKAQIKELNKQGRKQ